MTSEIHNKEEKKEKSTKQQLRNISAIVECLQLS